MKTQTQLYEKSMESCGKTDVFLSSSVQLLTQRILVKLNPNGKSTVDSLTLADEGFNFHYITNTFVTQTGKTYFFCYDYGYLKLENGQFMLIQKQDYIK